MSGMSNPFVSPTHSHAVTMDTFPATANMSGSCGVGCDANHPRNCISTQAVVAVGAPI